MIIEPGRWPGSSLPVKNPGRYQASSFGEAFGWIEPGELTKVHMRDRRRSVLRYASVDDLLDDGWTVD
jgi:hypothetical protein